MTEILTSFEPNVITHLTDSFFQGLQKNLVEFLDQKQSTVATWKSGNFIPFSVQREILRKSDKEGLGISPSDFFPQRLASVSPAMEPVIEAAE